MYHYSQNCFDWKRSDRSNNISKDGWYSARLKLPNKVGWTFNVSTFAKDKKKKTFKIWEIRQFQLPINITKHTQIIRNHEIS
jgi:hypothetical protein